MYKYECERRQGLKTKDRKWNREKYTLDWVMMVGIVGFVVISVRKDRDNVRKEEVLRGGMEEKWYVCMWYVCLGVRGGALEISYFIKKCLTILEYLTKKEN